MVPAGSHDAFGDRFAQDGFKSEAPMVAYAMAETTFDAGTGVAIPDIIAAEVAVIYIICNSIHTQNLRGMIQAENIDDFSNPLLPPLTRSRCGFESREGVKRWNSAPKSFHNNAC